MRISDWSSDVCSSDLELCKRNDGQRQQEQPCVATQRADEPLRAHPGLAREEHEKQEEREPDVAGVELEVRMAAGDRLRQRDRPVPRPRSAERRVGKECLSTCRSRL